MLRFSTFVKESKDDGYRFHVIETGDRPHAVGLVTKAGASSEHHKRFANFSDDIFHGVQKHEVVGSVKVYKHGDKYTGSSLSVDDGHRRKGVASRLYDHVERHLKTKLTPEVHQTDDGKAFWASRHKS